MNNKEPFLTFIHKPFQYNNKPDSDAKKMTL